jgi:hypothetical protein
MTARHRAVSPWRRRRHVALFAFLCAEAGAWLALFIERLLS